MEKQENNNNKYIYQFDSDYKLITKWISLNEILLKNPSYKQSAIRNNLCKISKSAYNFIWSYVENLQKPEIKINMIIDKNYFLDKDVFEYPQEDKEYWKDII